MTISGLPPWLRTALLLIVTGLIVTVIGGVIVVFLTRPQSPEAEGANISPTPIMTSSTVGTKPLSPTATPTLDSEGTATPDAGPPVRQSLVLADAVDREWCKVPGNTGSRWRSAALPLKGASHENGLTCEPWRAGQQGWLDFMRPDWATTLHVVAGVSDETASTTATIRVVVEDAITSGVLDESPARIGGPAKLNVPATTQRVRVRLILLDSVDQSRRPTVGFAGEWQR